MPLIFRKKVVEWIRCFFSLLPLFWAPCGLKNELLKMLKSFSHPEAIDLFWPSFIRFLWHVLSGPLSCMAVFCHTLCYAFCCCCYVSWAKLGLLTSRRAAKCQIWPFSNLAYRRPSNPLKWLQCCLWAKCRRQLQMVLPWDSVRKAPPAISGRPDQARPPDTWLLVKTPAFPHEGHVGLYPDTLGDCLATCSPSMRWLPSLALEPARQEERMLDRIKV